MAKVALRRLGALALALALFVVKPASAAETAAPPTEELSGTPFDAPSNAAVVARLLRGESIRRSSFARDLVDDDRARLGELGIARADVAIVSLHFVPRTDGARQVARLRALAGAPALFTPSGACDRIVDTAKGEGLCTGSVDGPVGSVPVRMTVAAALMEERGAYRLLLSNVRALEAKPLFAWTPIVDPARLKIAIDLYPTSRGWFVYGRVAFEMKAHRDSSKALAASLIKLDDWLARTLART